LGGWSSNDEKIERKVKKDIVQLCFITTENCNLRCKYCVYSGLYDSMRVHNNSNNLKWEDAKTAIDYFLNNNHYSSINTISFYGGESLLEFKLIKSIVSYVKSINADIKFAMNTNLTLLTSEILDFFIENNFTLTVSLDGPKEVHDLYRLTSNLKPTHDIVERNLWKIRSANEEYFIHHIIFNILIVPHNEDLDLLDRYFHGSLFNKMPYEAFKVLSLNQQTNSFEKAYNYNAFYSKFWKYSKQLFIDKHLLSEIDFTRIRVSYALHIDAIKKIFYREKFRIDDYKFYWPNGICVLGLRSTLITANGILYPCETLYDRKELAIGDIYKGVDISKVQKYTNDYIQNANKLCRDCWAFRFCSQCFINSFENNKYSMNKKNKACKETKNRLLDDFKLYFTIYLHNPAAFDYLQSSKPYEKFNYMLSNE
jgi:uncharacterized protein